MADLPPILTEALAAIGADIEAQIAELLRDFAALPLSEEDRLSALAGAIAAIAEIGYAEHGALFLAALRGWALDISIGFVTSAPRGRALREHGLVEEAQDVLLGGIDRILRGMGDAGATKLHRVVAELAVVARVLGRYDPRSIHLVLTAASQAGDDPTWQSGDLVPVSLCDGVRILSRDINIASVAPRGTA